MARFATPLGISCLLAVGVIGVTEAPCSAGLPVMVQPHSFAMNSLDGLEALVQTERSPVGQALAANQAAALPPFYLSPSLHSTRSPNQLSAPQPSGIGATGSTNAARLGVAQVFDSSSRSANSLRMLASASPAGLDGRSFLSYAPSHVSELVSEFVSANKASHAARTVTKVSRTISLLGFTDDQLEPRTLSFDRVRPESPDMGFLIPSPGVGAMLASGVLALGFRRR